MEVDLTISNGYVVYDRGKDSESSFWRYIYRKGVADAATLSTSLGFIDRTFELNSVGNQLIALAAEEEARERQIIFQCLGTQFSQTTSEFIREFNDILAQKEQLVSAMEKLKQFSSKSLRDVTSNKQFSSHFLNHFGTVLNANLTNFLGQLGTQIDSVNFSEYEQQIEEVIKQSIDQALDKALEQGNDGEDSAFYVTLQEIVSLFPNFRGAFREAIYSRFNINNIQRIVSNRAIKPGSKRTGIRSAIDSQMGLNLKNLRNTTYFAKSLREVVDNMIVNMGTSMQASRGKTINIGYPNNFEIFSLDQKIDLSSIESTTQMDQFDASQLNTLIAQLESYYNQNLAQLNQSLLVYRPLQTGNSFETRLRQYSGGVGLEKLDSILPYDVVSNRQSLDEFIEVARNVGNGAYFQEYRDSVYADLKLTLMSAAADFLLQDWDITNKYGTIGNQIQVISLGGKYLPLSGLYRAVGGAFVMASSNMESLVKVNIEQPKDIFYPDPISIISDDPMAEVLLAWEKQAKMAREQATFAIYFLQNFEQLVHSQLTF